MKLSKMTPVTLILQQVKQGDFSSTEALLPLVYDELRQLAAAQMAHERLDHTLQPTALVHEAYLRLVKTGEDQHWDSRKHFFGAAAEAMRRILIDQAREQASQKRGGNHRRVEVADFSAPTPTDPAWLLDLDDGIEQLTEEDPDLAKLVKLRLFAGLSLTEAGQMLGMSRTAAYRNWDFVRSWFALRAKTGRE